MHPYKTITQALLVLSILNPVFAAPIPRGANLLPAEGSAPLQDPAPSSGSPPLSATDGQVHQITEASTPARPLSPITAESSSTHTSSPPHTLSSTVTAKGTTAKPYSAVTHDMLRLDTQPKQLKFYQKPHIKVLGGVVLGVAALAAILEGTKKFAAFVTSNGREHEETPSRTPSDWSIYQK